MAWLLRQAEQVHLQTGACRPQPADSLKGQWPAINQDVSQLCLVGLLSLKHLHLSQHHLIQMQAIHEALGVAGMTCDASCKFPPSTPDAPVNCQRYGISLKAPSAYPKLLPIEPAGTFDMGS